MNTKSSKRVVIINNLNSANIEQAIFILKGSEKNEEVNSKLIIEAQQIIDNYIKRMENPRHEHLYKLEKRTEMPKKKVFKGRAKNLIIAVLSAAAFIGAIYFANILLLPLI